MHEGRRVPRFLKGAAPIPTFVVFGMSVHTAVHQPGKLPFRDVDPDRLDFGVLIVGPD